MRFVLTRSRCVVKVMVTVEKVLTVVEGCNVGEED